MAVKKYINIYENVLYLFKDTQGEKAPSNQTPAVVKSTNMDIWVVRTSAQVFIRGIETETEFSLK